MAKAEYTTESIEVLSGLDPVRKRPGMYTDTTRPNHLAQEVIDNSVDEAISGHATEIKVTLFDDGSIAVEDNGRGMPVEVHPEHKVSGVELILTRLHSGAKFSNKNYKFSGGLHGVGISVVNALSTKLEVQVKRSGNVYTMDFAHGDPVSKLKKVGSSAKNDTGTTVRFWPDAKYFDSPKFAIPKLKQLLKAKAVLCSGLIVHFVDDKTKQVDTWCYQGGLADYLRENLTSKEFFPNNEPWFGEMQGSNEEASWALAWVPEAGEAFQESYVNLVPTPQGGTHVNGLRTGVLEAIREFCEIQNLLPKGVKLAPEDVWMSIHFVLSVKLMEPQFASRVAAH